jgi:RimJ/RimL family protein N-acetyltransferase
MLTASTLAQLEGRSLELTDRELLRLHIEAVWNLNLPPFNEKKPDLLLPEKSRPPWSLYLGTLGNAQLALWKRGVIAAERSPLRERALQTGAVWESALRMRREMVFSAPILTWEHVEQAGQQARALNAGDASLLDIFEAESASYFLDLAHSPCVGVEVDGRLVTVAHSSRRTASACELGINTLPEARRRGYARVATTLWTALVQQQGLVPIYSAFAWNQASLQLAQIVGYQPRVDGVYGPIDGDREE